MSSCISPMASPVVYVHTTLCTAGSAGADAPKIIVRPAFATRSASVSGTAWDMTSFHARVSSTDPSTTTYITRVSSRSSPAAVTGAPGANRCIVKPRLARRFKSSSLMTSRTGALRSARFITPSSSEPRRICRVIFWLFACRSRAPSSGSFSPSPSPGADFSSPSPSSPSSPLFLLDFLVNAITRWSFRCCTSCSPSFPRPFRPGPPSKGASNPPRAPVPSHRPHTLRRLRRPFRLERSARSRSRSPGIQSSHSRSSSSTFSR